VFDGSQVLAAPGTGQFVKPSRLGALARTGRAA
jgi:hypothetical protein